MRAAKARAATVETDPAKQQQLRADSLRPLGGVKHIVVLNSLQQLAAVESCVTHKYSDGQLRAAPLPKEPELFCQLPCFTNGTLKVDRVGALVCLS